MEGGAPGFHFYTLNRADPTLRVLSLLGLEKRRHSLSLASNADSIKV